MMSRPDAFSFLALSATTMIALGFARPMRLASSSIDGPFLSAKTARHFSTLPQRTNPSAFCRKDVTTTLLRCPRHREKADNAMNGHGIIMTILIGLVVGIVAKFFHPGRDPGGFIITAVIGIAGSFLATYAGQAMGWYAPGQPAGFIASVVGALILLILHRMIAPMRK